MNEDLLGPLERRLGQLLFVGVMTSAVCLATGLVVWMMGGYPILANAVLTTGLVILMVTPVARVVTALVVYARMRDWFFVATTIAVFGVLLLAWWPQAKP
jgi:uncharacterized membrane protein